MVAQSFEVAVEKLRRPYELGREVNRFLMARDGLTADGNPLADPESQARRLERKLHAKLKAEHLNVPFDFAGLLIRVGEHTPDGTVEVSELVAL